MVALAPGDDVAPLRLAALDEILARELERGLDRLRPAAHEKNVADAGRGMGDQIVGQFLCHLRGEKTRMRIGQRVELRAHRRQHLRCECPRQDTAAPPEASMYSLPSLSRIMPWPLAAAG